MSLPVSAQPACSADTADAFYSDNPFEQQRALRLCACCPVLAACRELGAHEPFGIWGGLTPAERGFTKSGQRLPPARLPAESA
jgi:hypothetical protein